MIFFMTEIEPYTNALGQKRNPIPCTLKDGRSGFYFAEKKEFELINKGVIYEKITKSDLEINDTF